MFLAAFERIFTSKGRYFLDTLPLFLYNLIKTFLKYFTLS